MSPVNSMFVCIKKKKLSANLFLKWPISIIGKMLNIGADNRSTPKPYQPFDGDTVPYFRTTHLKNMILLIVFSVIETIEGLIRHILRYTEYNQ